MVGGLVALTGVALSVWTALPTAHRAALDNPRFAKALSQLPRHRLAQAIRTAMHIRTRVLQAPVTRPPREHYLAW